MKKTTFLIGLLIVVLSAAAQNKHVKDQKKDLKTQTKAKVVNQNQTNAVKKDQPAAGSCFIYVKNKKNATNIEFQIDSIVPAAGKPMAVFQIAYMDAFSGSVQIPPMKLYMVSVKDKTRTVTPLSFPNGDGYDFSKEKTADIQNEVKSAFNDSLELKILEPVEYMSGDMFMNLIKR